MRNAISISLTRGALWEFEDQPFNVQVPSDWLVLRAVMAIERAAFLTPPLLESTFEQDISLLGTPQLPKL